MRESDKCRKLTAPWVRKRESSPSIRRGISKLHEFILYLTLATP